MRLITRYVLRQMLYPFLFGVGAFTSIFVGTDLIFSLAELVSQWGVPVVTAVRFFFLNLPQIVVYTFPMATLLAALLTFSRFSSNGEIIAMRAGGIGFYRLVLPVLIVGLCVSLLTIAVNETVVPYATRAVKDIEWYARHDRDRLPATQEHIRILDVDRGEPNYLLYAREFNGDRETMYGVEVQEFENGNLSRLVRAESAVWTESGWDFRNGIIYSLEGGGSIPRMSFSSYNLYLDRSPRDLRRGQLRPEEMTFFELREHIAIKRREGNEPRDLIVDLHHKLAIPFASLIFAFVGAPLGLKPQRSGSSIGLGLSIVVIFIYYTVMTLSTALAQAGTLNPLVGAWLANVVFAGVGIYLIIRAGR